MDRKLHKKPFKRNYKTSQRYFRLRSFLDKKNTPKQHQHSSVFHHLWEELKAAIFVASLITVATYQFKLLDSDKIDSLQLMLSGLPGTEITSSNSKDSQIAVVLINDVDFETKFDQTSPLDRGELQRILIGIRHTIQGLNHTQNSTVKIFFDLDLSPSPSEWVWQSDGTNEKQSPPKKTMTSDFKAFYEEIMLLASGSEVYLIAPQAVLTTNLQNKKSKWMEDMCDNNVNFVFPYLPSSNDFVLQYYYADNSIASLFNGESTLCELYKGKFNELLRLHDSILFDKSKTRMMNFKSAATIPFVEASGFLLNEETADQDNINTDPFSEQGYKAVNTIFVGGSYGQSDIFDTPLGALSGVYLHAASYLSEHPENVISEKYSKVIGYILEIVLGTVIGILFFYLAQYYRNKQNLMSIALNIILQPAIALVTIWISAILLLHACILINPAPLILSMALHAEFVRLDEPKDKQQSQSLTTKLVLKSIYCIALCWAFFILIFDFIK